MYMKKNPRLESIKEAHHTQRKGFSTRVEDYLEVISELVEMKGYATTLDISRYMSVRPPSVTNMLKKLDNLDYLEYEKYHGIHLTKKGIQLAEAIRLKHSILLEFFEILGVNHKTANNNAEGIEHHLDEQTIRRLRKFLTFLKSKHGLIQDFKNL
ncbi:MAG: iron dependent repressor, metal binding and dimerization domain protein [Candidatus Nitrosoabyssus spongiisocia]|nr:MAG: iron dependent repressor, metal binding and dimerization domain protein [Nitrosopumilaceae archaeon AB1(1)]